MTSGSLVETSRDGQASHAVFSLLMSAFPAFPVVRKKKDVRHYRSQTAALFLNVTCQYEMFSSFRVWNKM